MESGRREQHEFSAVLDAVDVEMERERRALPIVTAREVMKRPKDKRFIVKDFIQPKTVNMMYSPPGTFKSLIALDMALCIAGGDDWLGMKTKRGRVLYLDKENSETSLRDRLVGLMAGHKWKRKKNPNHVHLLLKFGNLQDPEFVDNVAAFAHEQKVDLVVVDTLRRFGNFEENSSKDINDMYWAFQKIINGTNASILFLHHANKEGQTYRGSVDLLGQVDSCYRIEREGKPGSYTDNFKMVCEKSRTGEIDCINGRFGFTEDEITITKTDDELEKVESDAYAKFKFARTAALNEIAKLCPMAGTTFRMANLWKEIDALNMDKEPADRIARRTLERAIGNMVKTRYLVKTGVKGEYRRLFSGSDGVFKPQDGVNGVLQ